jgi:hypothetical protein
MLMTLMEDYKVIGIKAEETHAWLLNKHYAKRLPTITDSFGLYEKNHLVGVLTFGVPASPFLCKGICGEEHSKIVRELNRLCLSDNKKNQASYFVAKALKLLSKPKIIVSYADTEQGHIGKVYQACNFLYTGATKERTDVDTGDKHSRHIKGLDYSKRKNRSSKHRYVYFIGSKKERKQLKESLRYPVEPFPIGESRRYDAGGTVKTQPLLF